MLVYIMAYVAYIGEAGHFRLTPQLVFWAIGTMFWTIRVFAIPDKFEAAIAAIKTFSIISFLIADILIFLFIVAMVDLSITDRGWRRILGLAMPMSEVSPQIRSHSELYKVEDIGKRLSFFEDQGKRMVSLSLKYKPIPESVNLWEGVLNFPPNTFSLKDKYTLISETNMSESLMTTTKMEFSIRYSYDTKENQIKDVER